MRSTRVTLLAFDDPPRRQGSEIGARDLTHDNPDPRDDERQRDEHRDQEN